ncbi:MAG: CHASE2 domain-containing protein [Cyanobacteria bacterium J06626_18]
MSKRIVLTFLEKSEKGYPVSLNIQLNAHNRQASHEVTQVMGMLPLIPQSLQAALQSWQLPYRKMLASRTHRMIIKTDSERRFSWPDKAKTLNAELNHWLNSGGQSWQKIRDALLQALSQDEENRIFLQTGEVELQQLPWSAWNVFDRYFPKTEVILSPPEICQPALGAKAQDRQRFRILVVLGDRDQIDLKLDRQMLQRLERAGADVQFLDEPDRQTFLDALWDEHGWDIFYFGGHSGEGLIGLNQELRLEPNTDFKYGICKAIARGLQLAIFNSCDGLKLANELARLNLPRSIVMREPVPDEVAQDFLVFFLTAFEQGRPLSVSVHEARQKLEDAWTYKYPGCGWLPVVFQHPSIASLTDLPQPPSESSSEPLSPPRPRLNWWTVAAVSLMVTSLVVGIRSLGVLQSWELGWFDQLIRLRPAELSDERIVIITVGESDIQYQQQNQMGGRGSLSDAALAQLLQKLKPHQPRVIGLDIYHDFEYEPQLANQLVSDSRFIAPCKVGNARAEPDSIAGPPQIPTERLGFTDFPSDPDTAIRRQLIGMAADRTGCSTQYALSSRVALAYLGPEYAVSRQPGGTLTIGATSFPKLPHTAGGYQLDPDNANGYQILVNYRSQSPRQVSLEAVLRGEVDDHLADWVRDRIVLIGLGNLIKDSHLTSYSHGAYPERMLGVEIHAQMTSQILSAVLDQRPLLWWYPEWLEWIWIYSWSLLGGAIVWRFRSVSRRSLSIGIAGVGLSGICFMALLWGGWLPLVPAVLGIFSTSGVSVLYLRLLKSRHYH